MADILQAIRSRSSQRTRFDRERPVRREDLEKILEAARWAPTAHNMQNFQIVVVDDQEVLRAIAALERRVSMDFIRENYRQLSFSEDELKQRKVGLLATRFPPSWRTPGKLDEGAAAKEPPSALAETLRDAPALLVVIYDPRTRAPASEGDFLGIISLGCVLENMWLEADALGIGFHVVSALGANEVAPKVKALLGVPDFLKIAFACRLGYPVGDPVSVLRVRRDVDDFTHHNAFGRMGVAGSGRAERSGYPRSLVEPFRFHVYLCQQEKPNPECCSARGSAAVLEALRKEIAAQGLGDEVQVTTCGSLGLCARGPNLVVYPDGVWYSGVHVADVAEIVREHFREGKPVRRLVNEDATALKREILENRAKAMAARAREKGR